MKKIILVILLLIGTFMVTGCTNETKNNEEKLNIVTSFYPMYIATSNIIDGVDGVSLKCLASPSVGCLHDYQLTVNDMITLEGADIFVINGGGMESFLDKAVSSYPDLIVVNASENLLDAADDTDKVNETHEEGIHSHDEEINSHVWVSISMYIEEIKSIAQKLAKYDVEHAALYTSNAEKYINTLESLKEEMHEKLDGVSHKNIVTFHEAFDYFAEEFHFDVVAVIEREPGTSPSAKDIADIIEVVNSKEVNAIFTEPQYSKNAATTIAKETGVFVYELDPIVTGALEKDAYEKAMQKNLSVLMEALK